MMATSGVQGELTDPYKGIPCIEATPWTNVKKVAGRQTAQPGSEHPSIPVMEAA